MPLYKIVGNKMSKSRYYDDSQSVLAAKRIQRYCRVASARAAGPENFFIKMKMITYDSDILFS